ncbi:acetokinase family protein [Sarocladium implicatum]|nr:acetokinase family protein [Sarocladium implicatum]
MKILLAINAGSSSVKISVYSIATDNKQSPTKIADLQVSGLTAPPAKLEYTRHGASVKDKEEVKADSQDAAFKIMLDTLISDDQLKELSNSDDIAVAAHRIVHGGDYDDVKVINKETYHHLEELSDLAPLHNGSALQIVSSCISQLPRAANVACFDSQFHASIPAHIATYPIDQDVARKNKLRKYGFHGISYAFVTRTVAEHLKKDVAETSVIALHLGSGASACAIKNGKSWDTSMGLTPLSGLPGATRSGSVDPSLVFHFASDVGKLSPNSTSKLHISKAEEILNKQSGWRSLTGTTDFSAISSDSSDTPDSHRLAFDLFVDRIAAFVGSYYVSLEGKIDALVFAGGIGEHSERLREEVVRKVKCLGFGLDGAKNGNLKKGELVVDVGEDGATYRVLVCKTDEQFEMARMCAEKAALWQ